MPRHITAEVTEAESSSLHNQPVALRPASHTTPSRQDMLDGGIGQLGRAKPAAIRVHHLKLKRLTAACVIVADTLGSEA